MAQPYLSAQEILKRTFINNTGSLKVTSEPYSIQDYLNAVFDSNSNSLRVYSEQAAESSSSSIGSVGNIIAGEGISIVNDIISIDTTVSEIGSFLVRTEDGVGWGIPSGSLPVVTSQDNDKVLTVINGAWAKAFPTTELPIVTVADNDKILTVVSGAWAKADAPSSGTTYTAGDGIDITNDTISINSASATTGQILSKGETGTTWVASPVSATTANVQTALSIDTGAGSLAKVLSERGTFVDLPVNTDTTYTAGNGIDITNEVISIDVTGATTGQVLKKTELGIGWANDETGTAELPTVTVADNDKILTVVAGVWTKAAPGSPYAIESLHALPEAIVGNLGKTVFYTGPTENGLYKNSFYVLEEVGVEPEITYEWIAYGVANSSISIKQAILTLHPEDPPNPVLIDVLGNIQDIDDENNADNVIETHYRIDFSGYILSMENYESEEAALTDRYYGKMSYNSDNNITNIFMTVEEYTVMSSFTAGKNILKINYLENPEVSIGNTVSDGASTLPVVTVADNDKVLTVVNGNWEKADAPNGVTTENVQVALSINPVDGLEEKILSQKGTFVDLPAGGAQGLPGADGTNGVTPHIGSNGNWFIGEADTEIPAQGPAGNDGENGAPGLPGEDGTNGITPHIDAGGNWFIGETDTDIAAQGPAGADGQDGTNGIAPHIDVGGNWFIGETDTGIAAQGPAGQDGADGEDGQAGADGANGVTPHIDIGGNWFIGETDTGIPAQGPAGKDGEDGAQGLPGEDGTNGITPHVGLNGNWFIGETDTGIQAQGPAGEDGTDGADGSNGITPHIDETTGNWFIGEMDTGIPATGPAGKDGNDGAQGLPGEDGSNGITPHIGLNGNWFIGLTDTEIPATGPAGQNGQDGSAGIDGNSINWLGELASAPGSPVNYDAYHNTTDGNSYIYNSTASAWQTLAQRGTDGEDGADGSNGTDGVSITWLGTLASAPAEPTLSTAYYNSTAKQAYIWDGDSWETLCKNGTDGQDGADGASIFQQDITPLTGTPVSVSAGGVYSWTISGASVINKGTWANSGLEYAVMLITVEAGGSVTGGTGITLVDALVAGFNYCILRGINGAVDLLISPE